MTTAHQHALTMLGKSKGELSWMHYQDTSLRKAEHCFLGVL